MTAKTFTESRETARGNETKRAATNRETGNENATTRETRNENATNQETARTAAEKGLLYPRQIALLFVAFVPLSKLLYLPALFSASARNDLWVSLLFLFAADALTLTLVLIAAKTGESFPNVFFRAFGNVGGRVVLFLYALQFLIKAFVPLGEERVLIQLGLYETTPSFFYFAPLFAFAFFLLTKTPTAIGRAADLLSFVTVGAIAAMLLFALPSAKAGALLPVLYQNGRGVLQAARIGAAYFGEAIYPLFLMGNFGLKDRGKSKIYGGFLISAAVTVCFFAVFYAVFSSVAENIPISLTEISKHNLSVSDIGRIDYFSLAALLLSSTVGLILPAYFAARCICAAIGRTGRTATRAVAFSVTVALAATILFTETAYAEIATAIRSFFFLAFLLFQLVFPAYIALFSVWKNGKRAAARNATAEQESANESEKGEVYEKEI